ncbi:hypothetical protein POTOM_048218 [Populus tomentosa]|uniref:Kazal-like domain-containing protein n=1 Tax=Populus tomentosa TaxID=118781 RepID=A0A8X7YCP6_POPTO|nr:hypothetical protein POTOM_048218 [Populus tomentosa]
MVQAQRGSVNLCPGSASRGTCTGTINCFRADPVCGANGVTYGCGCPEAACAHVRVVNSLVVCFLSFSIVRFSPDFCKGFRWKLGCCHR